MTESLKSSRARASRNQRAVLIILSVMVGFFMPSLVLVTVQIVVGGVPVLSAIVDVLDGQFAQGRNLFTLALLGLLPFIVLAAMVPRFAARHPRRACTALWASGLVGILAVMVPGHAAVWWPLYGPGRMSSTAVIAFLFIPVYCAGSLFLGLAIGRLVIRMDWFQPSGIGHCHLCGYNLKGNTSGVCPECGEKKDVGAIPRLPGEVE